MKAQYKKKINLKDCSHMVAPAVERPGHRQSPQKPLNNSLLVKKNKFCKYICMSLICYILFQLIPSIKKNFLKQLFFLLIPWKSHKCEFAPLTFSSCGRFYDRPFGVVSPPRQTYFCNSQRSQTIPPSIWSKAETRSQVERITTRVLN